LNWLLYLLQNSFLSRFDLATHYTPFQLICNRGQAHSNPTQPHQLLKLHLVAKHFLHDVAIVGIYSTPQARVLENHNSETITVAACKGAMEDAGLTPADIDGVAAGGKAAPLIYWLRNGPAWRSMSPPSIPALLQAAAAIAAGQCHTVLVADGMAGVYTQRQSTAPWTRPSNEFVLSYGMFTAAEFALIARRHMHLYGTTPEQLATVSATIRNNGHVHPDAIYQGRGPFTPDDILASRMVADPFHLLDCAMTSEGGCAMVLTNAQRAKDLPNKPIWILGGSGETFGPAYQHPPQWSLSGRSGEINGLVGKRVAQQAFGMAGVTHSDIDVCEFYDPFSFEIIRQFEAFGFCEEGEGGDFVMDGRIEVGGEFPVTTDGGVMSFSHGGAAVQQLQRVTRAVEQLRGTCLSRQVSEATVAMASNGGAGALFSDLVVLGSEQPA